MEIQYDLTRKLCLIWLKNGEKDDFALQISLKPMYQANRANGYRTVVFYSGTQELYANIKDLLGHNRNVLS